MGVSAHDNVRVPRWRFISLRNLHVLRSTIVKEINHSVTSCFMGTVQTKQIPTEPQPAKEYHYQYTQHNA